MMFDTSATYGWKDCGVSGYNTGKHRSIIARCGRVLQPLGRVLVVLASG